MKTDYFNKKFILGKCWCGCGNDLPSIQYENWLRKFISGHQNRGKNHPKWKGRIKNSDGYWLIWKPDHLFANHAGYVMEHRLVYEEYYNVCLLPWIDIHHIDPVTKDYCNNDISNLKPVTRKEHKQEHQEDMSGRRCSICGSDKTKIRPNGRPHWYGNKKKGWRCFKCYYTEKRKLGKLNGCDAKPFSL